MTRDALTVIVGATIVVATGALAETEPHPIDLRWQAPTGCPTEAEVAAEIDRLLGGRPSGARRMSVRADARSTEDGWVLEMHIRDDRHPEEGEGERRVTGATCAELGNAGALIIALAFDPQAVAVAHGDAGGDGGGGADSSGGGFATGPEPGGGAGAATAILIPTPPPPTPPPPTPAPWTPPPPESSTVWLSVGPLVGVDIGSLPAPALSVGGNVGLRWHPIAAQLRARYVVPAEETLGARPSTGGRFDLWALSPRFCMTPWHTGSSARRRLGDLDLDLCAEVDIGQMRGEGFGVRNPGEGTALWVAPAGAADLELALMPWLSARVDIGLGVPVLRPQFVLDAVGVVHEASPVTGRGDLEIIVVF